MDLLATPEHSGKRLDVWLAQMMPDMSRSRIQALIADGHICVAGRRARPSLKIKPGTAVTVQIPPLQPAGLEPEDIPLEVLHEDADIIVVNKPPGLVVHPAAGHATGTLVNAILHHCPGIQGIGGERRPGIVHRLDKDTSGAMVIAKTDSAMMALSSQFRRRAVEKDYLALVRGCPTPAEQRVETLIGRSRDDRKRMSTRPAGKGRTAVTRIRVLRDLQDFALISARIETGRTHQIRVHMAFMGHPVAGDRQYGGRRERADAGHFPRQMLHAATLTFTHPATRRPVSFSAPPPADFKAALASLGVGWKELSLRTSLHGCAGS